MTKPLFWREMGKGKKNVQSDLSHPFSKEVKNSSEESYIRTLSFSQLRNNQCKSSKKHEILRLRSTCFLGCPLHFLDSPRINRVLKMNNFGWDKLNFSGHGAEGFAVVPRCWHSSEGGWASEEYPSSNTQKEKLRGNGNCTFLMFHTYE